MRDGWICAMSFSFIPILWRDGGRGRRSGDEKKGGEKEGREEVGG